MDVPSADCNSSAALTEHGSSSSPASGPQLDFASLWQQLTTGRWAIEAQFSEGLESFLVLRQPRIARTLPSANVLALKKVLLGKQLKSVAAELDISTSSVSVYLSNTLRAMGAGRSVSRCSILLVMAAHANDGYRQPRLELRGWDASPRLTVAASTPGQQFRSRLTRSEWEIARLTIEGTTTQRLAELRQACPRTVANQIASAYQKLQVSGRAALRALAVSNASASLADPPDHLPVESTRW